MGKNILQKHRDSNMEMLRIICMFFIVIHHSVLYSSAIEMNFNINLLFSDILFIGGKLGSNCFVIISAYYLCDSTFKTERIINIWLTTIFYSVGIFVVNLLVNFTDNSIQNFVEAFLPISSGAYWFITAYLGVMLLSPLLNFILHKMSMRATLVTLIILGIMICLPITLMFGLDPYGSSNHYMLFIYLYLLIGYIKKFKEELFSNRNFGIRLFTATFLVMSLLTFVILGIGYLADFEILMEKATYFSSYGENLLQVFCALGLFITIKNIKIKSNKLINLMSRATIDVYLIHMNHLLYIIIWNRLFNISDWYYSNKFILIIIGSAFIVYLSTTIIGMLRIIILEKLVFKIPRLQALCYEINSEINSIFYLKRKND